MHIYGVGGIGKSSVMGRYEWIAEQLGHLATQVAEGVQGDISAALDGRLVQGENLVELDDLGWPSCEPWRRYSNCAICGRVYRQHMLCGATQGEGRLQGPGKSGAEGVFGLALDRVPIDNLMDQA